MEENGNKNVPNKDLNQFREEIKSKTMDLRLLNEQLTANALIWNELKRTIIELELEEQQTTFNLNIYLNLRQQKQQLLEDEKNKLKKLQNEYFNERTKYCDELHHFLETEINSQATNLNPAKQQADKIQFLNNEIQHLEKEIEEKKIFQQQQNENEFKKKVENATKAEEFRYQKVLEERRTELKSLTYEIKLKKLRRNQEILKNKEQNKLAISNKLKPHAYYTMSNIEKPTYEKKFPRHQQ